jgi:proline iminopeptidase
MFITINDNKLYYEVHGNEDGEPIFFIHGGPGLGDCRNDSQTFSVLGDQYKLVFLDMRGSGRSEANPPFTHEQWTADIHELRNQLELGKINIHGSSYGGFIALEYVLRYPEYVTRVMLNVTSSNNKHHHLAIENAMKSDLPGMDRDMLERLFAGKVASDEEFKEMFTTILPLYAVQYDEEKARERLESIYFHYETHNEAFRNNLANYDLTERLHEIKVPVLVTGGRHDWITPAECSEEIAAGIKGSTLVIFENNGHSLIRERTEEYISLLKDFLSKEFK